MFIIGCNEMDRPWINTNSRSLLPALKTTKYRVGGYADSTNNHYYELLNDEAEIQPEHKLARTTMTTVQGEDEEVTVTLEQQIKKFVIDNNGDIVQGQERTFTNVQHCLVQEEDLLGYMNEDGMTKSELVQ